MADTTYDFLNADGSEEERNKSGQADQALSNTSYISPYETLNGFESDQFKALFNSQTTTQASDIVTSPSAQEDSSPVTTIASDDGSTQDTSPTTGSDADTPSPAIQLIGTEFVRGEGQSLAVAASNLPAGADDRTITAWIQRSAPVYGDADVLISQGYINGYSKSDVMLNWANIDGSIAFDFQIGAVYTDATNINDGKPHFLALSFNRSEGVKIWLDGEQLETHSWNNFNPASVWTAQTGQISFGGQAGTIGGYGDQTYYSGRLGEARVYNTVLSDSDVKNLYEEKAISSSSVVEQFAGQVPNINSLVNNPGSERVTHLAGATSDLDAGFIVSSGSDVKVTVDGVSLTSDKLASNFSKSTSNGLDTYRAKINAFNGSEAITVSASIKGLGGIQSDGSGTNLKAIDTTAPDAPTISDNSINDGYFNAFGNTPSQALTGTAEANSTVNIYLNGSQNPVYTTVADQNGHWSQVIGVLQGGAWSSLNGGGPVESIYSYSVSSMDAAGNTSQSKNLVLTTMGNSFVAASAPSNDKASVTAPIDVDGYNNSGYAGYALVSMSSSEESASINSNGMRFGPSTWGFRTGLTARSYNINGSSNLINYSIVTDETGSTQLTTGPFQIDTNGVVWELVREGEGPQLNFDAGLEQKLYVKSTSIDGSFSVSKFTLGLYNLVGEGGEVWGDKSEINEGQAKNSYIRVQGGHLYVHGDASYINNGAKGGDDVIDGLGNSNFFDGDVGYWATGIFYGGNDIITVTGIGNTLYGDGGHLNSNSTCGSDKLSVFGNLNMLNGDAVEMRDNSVGGNNTLAAVGDYNRLIGSSSVMMASSISGDNHLSVAGSNNFLFGSADDLYDDAKGGNNTLSAQGNNNKLVGTAWAMEWNASGGNNTLVADGNYNSLYGDAGINHAFWNNAAATSNSLTVRGNFNSLYGHYMNSYANNSGVSTLTAFGNRNYLIGDAVFLAEGLKASDSNIFIYGNDNDVSGDVVGSTIWTAYSGTVSVMGGNDTISLIGDFNRSYGDAYTLEKNSFGGNDVINSTGNNNILYGDALSILNSNTGGNDIINATGNNNALYGDAGSIEGNSIGGNDKLLVVGVNNTVSGDAWTINQNANSGNDILIAKGAGNYLYGDAQRADGQVTFGNDTLNADGIENYLIGDCGYRGSAEGVIYGNDTLTSTGTNKLIGDNQALGNWDHGGDDVLTATGYGNALFGDGTSINGNGLGGNDVLTAVGSFNSLYGDAVNLNDNSTGGDDELISSGDINTLYGDALSLNGNSAGGNDTLITSSGTDYLYGDAVYLALGAVGGADTFKFLQGTGDHYVMDFHAAEGDKIDLSAYGFTGMNDIAALIDGSKTLISTQGSLSDYAGGTLLSLGDGNNIHIQGIAPTALNNSDFAWANNNINTQSQLG